MNAPPTRTLPWMLAGAAGAVALLSAGAVLAMRLGLTYPCPFKFLLGIPCPTCGMTRSFAALASLDFAQALRFNPLVIIGGAGTLTGWFLRHRFAWIGRFGPPLLIAALLLNWIYLILFLPR
jgi:hypothetical protein